MLFSVVIPLYNKADTIERTIRSVWAQSFKDYELIVINDGSSDGSLSVVQRLEHECAFKIIDKPNGGVSSARNAGANAASGRYIALLDGDDVWYHDHLKQLADAIVKHPEVKFFGTGYERIAGKYIYYTIPWGGCCVKDVYSVFRYGQPINTSTVAINRDLWKKVGGFDERYSFYEDYEFFFRLGLHTKCCVVRQVTGVYTDDAKIQITRQPIALDGRVLPHFLFIEKMMGDGCVVSKDLVRYVSTQMSVRLCVALVHGALSELKFYKQEFPWLVTCSHLLPIAERNKVLGRCIGWLYLLYYRLRNHIVIWRRGNV